MPAPSIQRQQRLQQIDLEIERLKDGLYRATLSSELFVEWAQLLERLEAERDELSREGD